MELASISCLLLYQTRRFDLGWTLERIPSCPRLLLFPSFQPSFPFFYTEVSGLVIAFRLVTYSTDLNIISFSKPSQHRPPSHCPSLVCFDHIKFFKIPRCTINFNIFTFCLSFAFHLIKVLFCIFSPIDQSYS